MNDATLKIDLVTSAVEWVIYKYQRRGAAPNKGYIGQTCQALERRDCAHQSAAENPDSSHVWARALRKYGREAFDLTALEKHSTFEAAMAAEIRLISEHKTHRQHGGYNATFGGDGVLGFSPSLEHRLRTRAAMKAAWADPDQRARRIESNRRAMADPETRARVSSAVKRALADPKIRERMSAVQKRLCEDPEERAKRSASTKRAMADPETRARVEAAAKIGLASPKVRARMSAAMKRKYEDPEARAKQSAAMKRAMTPEVLARKSATMKKRYEDPGALAKMRASVIQAKADPEVRARMSIASKRAWENRRAATGRDGPRPSATASNEINSTL